MRQSLEGSKSGVFRAVEILSLFVFLDELLASVLGQKFCVKLGSDQASLNVFVQVAPHGFLFTVEVQVSGIEWVVKKAISSLGGILWQSFELGALGVVVDAKSKLSSSKQDGAQQSDLPDGVTKDVSPHHLGDDWLILSIWLSHKNVALRWLSGKGKSTEGVHDQVDPKELDGSEGRVLQDNSSEEDHEHGDHVD